MHRTQILIKPVNKSSSKDVEAELVVSVYLIEFIGRPIRAAW